MSHGHEIIKCSCGKIIAQCRCMSKDKTVTIIEKGCEDCKNLTKPKEQELEEQYLQEELSMCDKCYCMTKTIVTANTPVCGKCKEIKAKCN